MNILAYKLRKCVNKVIYFYSNMYFYWLTYLFSNVTLFHLPCKFKQSCFKRIKIENILYYLKIIKLYFFMKKSNYVKKSWYLNHCFVLLINHQEQWCSKTSKAESVFKEKRWRSHGKNAIKICLLGQKHVLKEFFPVSGDSTILDKNVLTISMEIHR